MIAIYKPPILTTVFRIIGIITLIASIAVGIILLRADSLMKADTGESDLVWNSVGTMAAGVLAFLFYWGIAQAIDFLGRSAFFTEQLFLQTTTQAAVRGSKGRPASGTIVPGEGNGSAEDTEPSRSGERTKFECGECGQRISAMTAEIGSHIACPNCGEDVVVS